MSAVKRKSNGPVSSRVVRSLVIVVILAVLAGVTAKLAMGVLNRKMGLESAGTTEPADTVLTEQNMETVAMPEFDPDMAMETGLSVWAPDWKSTPCSLFVTSESDAVLDSLPQSPGPESRNTELQLLIELWADCSGFEPLEIERVWAFASGDTCFIDLPRQVDWQGVVKTVEGRFISFTVLFPFVAGELVEGFEDGIPVQGIPAYQ
ncbi:hypothetical protein DRQ21_06475 [Candidatus Fermentibacteria bacterium]|nr:MAG: hypothetical protein DRQ21_06475 [Candidatus Fermentibacteria bacterium]